MRIPVVNRGSHILPGFARVVVWVAVARAVGFAAAADATDALAREFTFFFGDTSPVSANDAATREFSVFAGPVGSRLALTDTVAREFSLFAGSPQVPPVAADAVTREFSLFAGSPELPLFVADAVTREFSIFAGEPPFIPVRDAVAREFSVHVPAAPSVTLNPEPLVYLEGAGVVVIDPTAAVADPDTDVLAGGYLRVSINGGAAPGDVLGIAANGPAGITLEDGDEVWFDGASIGIFAGGTDGEPLLVELNTNATLAAVEALVRSVTFANPLRFPTGGVRPVVFVLSDGDAGEGPAAIRAIEVIPFNHPPVAGPDFLGAARDTPLPVAVETLLLNDFDPDGDPLHLSLPDTASAAGAVLSLEDGMVTYAPPVGFTGTDVFTYLLADPFGGEADGRVTVYVRAEDDPAITILEMGMNGEGEFEMRAVGLPDRIYEAFTSLDLVTWTPLGEVETGSAGEFRFVHPGTVSDPRRFFRFSLRD